MRSCLRGRRVCRCAGAPTKPASTRIYAGIGHWAQRRVSRMPRVSSASLSRVQVHREREGWVAPEARLMTQLLQKEGSQRASALAELQASWRQVFVDVLRPTHLPQVERRS